MKIALTIVLALEIASNAATFTAPTTSLADFNTTMGLCSDGDTLVIPAGTSTWASFPTVTKALLIQGAGTNSTIIKGSTALMVLQPGSGKYIRLTGFTFDLQNNAIANGTIQIIGTSGGFCRIYSCVITNTGAGSLNSGFQSYDAIGSLIDHCQVLDYTGIAFYTFNQNYGLANSYGDGSWNDGPHFGTTNGIVCEDCFFRCKQNPVGVADSGYGARFTFRHNTITNDYFVAHGTDSTGRPRGTRAVEIYNNSWLGASGVSGAELRSGTALIYSNAYDAAFGAPLICKNYRNTNTSCKVVSDYPPWGAANGTGAYDNNSAGSLVIACDQVGRGSGDLLSGVTPSPTGWPHQASEPVYAWSNTVAGVLTGVGICGLTPEIQPGVDVINNTIAPGYTPLAYPHPLIGVNSGYSSQMGKVVFGKVRF